eukprot:CAMPEP_0114623266 /NCGR_PEP_ID=MMETSP0168-20121206/10158_1 /TAXON_ID=95228 ORGANISM="Vannella sp., Strain DIVA3 517/6/12" /NCGR_SAMPLE_ID=MMETSP0168 /ASSEMBLY_ACC=CAM_ASM_000044 /LENGTH=121 /DNA_ID=CAMNT_0001834495 /DNA_START=48 /DNA_END=410 /DNA_ORIENTATION=+
MAQVEKEVPKVKFVDRVQEPWFKLLKQGTKRYEGRVRRNHWAMLVPGERFRFVVAQSKESEEEEERQESLLLAVTSVHCFATFGDAWEELGDELIPPGHGVDSSREAVEELYSQFYSEEVI